MGGGAGGVQESLPAPLAAAWVLPAATQGGRVPLRPAGLLSSPSLRSAAVPSPIPPAAGTLCRPPPPQMPVALRSVFLFVFLSAHRHIVPERCIADTAQLRGPGDPRPRPACLTASRLGLGGSQACSLGRWWGLHGSCNPPRSSPRKQAGWRG